jgi:coproporphyrinogen III oxidase
MSTMRTKVTEYIQDLQMTIVNSLQQLDRNAPEFTVQTWSRAEGGHGRTCTFAAASASSVLEKAAVNISMINGKLPPASIRQMATEHSALKYSSDENESLPFFAGGISLIIHATNPNIPTVHANYRYFEITETEETEAPKVIAWWFGGTENLPDRNTLS